MFDRTIEGRPEACLSDLRFDALLADELAPSEEHDVRAHLADCDGCRARLGSLQQQRARFLASELATPAFLDSVAARRARQNRSRRSRAFAVLGLAAAVATAALVVVRDVGPREREKGTESISFFVRRGDLVRRGSVAEPLRPGDLVRDAFTIVKKP